MDHEIDKHFIGFLEYRQKLYQFKRIDTELPEEMQEKDLLDHSKLIEQFKNAVDCKQMQVKTARLKDTNLPALMLLSEEAQRLRQTQDSIILNTASPLVKRIPYLRKKDRSLICQLIYVIAKMNNRQLTPEEMKVFTERSIASLDLLTERIKSDVEVTDAEIIL